MTLFDLFFVDNTGFKSFDQSHLIVLGLFAGSIVAMVAAKNSSVAAKARATHALAYLTAGTVVVWTLLRLATGKFTPSVDMPFDICNMTAIVWLPLLTFAPKRGWGAGVRQVLFDGMLFTAFPGTIQAFFTPHLYDAFPHITWLKFWIVHGGIIVGVLAAGILDGMRTSRPLWRAIVHFHLFMTGSIAFSFVMSVLLDGNFTYSRYPPPTGSALDFFGPWPLYFLVSQLAAYPVFAINHYVCHAFDGSAPAASTSKPKPKQK
jgi:hypothetical integral membrane protein (TIGR02206 family)